MWPLGGGSPQAPRMTPAGPPHGASGSPSCLQSGGEEERETRLSAVISNWALRKIITIRSKNFDPSRTQL